MFNYEKGLFLRSGAVLLPRSNLSSAPIPVGVEWECKTLRNASIFYLDIKLIAC